MSGLSSIFKVIEYKPIASQGLSIPEGKIIKQFTGKRACERANALRDKLSKVAPKGTAYFIKGELAVKPYIPSIEL